ncbi:trafficking protein particle complex subunit 8-like isoform X2 [Gigantopelta aegis]|uniref:trafficking protein particle complex subunit 8-like isoform X2 n=1 Tax=Gigantopelta aegis TaxID=1735272 RepID=UPI001B88D09A|nr:trafficking protein particle complex subunit 8-like isoform X2 [Gigantopelta aegis]
MAQCKQSAPEFIQNAFSPHIAVLCSADAEVLCKKNNLTFAQLIQPFCRLGTEVHIRDPNNAPHTVHSLRIKVCDMSSTPPQQADVRKMLNDAVSGAQLQTGEAGRCNVKSVGSYDLQLHESTPWFEAYRECFLDVITPSDHEYLSHCLACAFVVSSSNTDPIAIFNSLTGQQLQQQQQFPNKVPRWFCPGILNYYVLLHDVVEGEQARAEAIYQSMKSTFKPHCCHLLQINSRSLQTVENMKSETSLPDPWSQFLPQPQEIQEGVEYDYLQSQDEDSLFPSHLSEGDLTHGQNLDSSSIMEGSIETGLEATETKVSESTSTSDLMMDHPLAFTAPVSLHEDADVCREGDGTAAANGYQDSKSSLSPSELREKAKLRAHGICLTSSDMDRLKIFMHEFVVRALIPWAEHQMRIFNDQLTSRKGLHRSFFSATKKWFGSNKPAGPVQANQNTSVVYTSEAPELQLRRLADLAFLFQMYDFAYHTYHTAKRDFNNDHAWLHFAGALEMASVSIFMLGSASQRQYPHHYMESAITTYLTSCRNIQYATRATLVSTEALKCRGMFHEAAMQFLKMTSEDTDLVSALFLEQAAHCYINMKSPMVRKYAFHMILAGHRFNKSGQRKHSLRAYSQALQIFKGKQWKLSEDHIHFTIGRQSFNLKQLENATSAFKHLLMGESKQPAAQQGAYIREYLFVYKQQLALDAGESCSYGRLPELPMPNLDVGAIKVLLGAHSSRQETVRKTPASGIWFDHDEEHNSKWQSLEERLVLSANNGVMPVAFRPTLRCFTNKTENKFSPATFVGEPIIVEVEVENPLLVTLVLSDIMLLWSFLPGIAGTDKPQLISNEVSTGVKNNLADEIIQTTVVKEVVLEGHQRKPIHLTLVPRQPGELRVVGLAYNLGTSSQNASAGLSGSNNTAKGGYMGSIYVRGKQRLEVQGPRLNITSEDKTQKNYGPDRRLDLVVLEEMPILEVNFCDFPDSLLCGEVHCIEIEITNSGRSPLHRLKVTSSDPTFFTFGSGRDLPKYPYVYQMKSVDRLDTSAVESSICDTNSRNTVVNIPLPNAVLKPGEVVSVPLWLRGNDIGGVHEVDFLFYYEPVNIQSKVRHRILQHKAVVKTVESLSVRATVTKPSTCVTRNQGQELNSCIISCELENLSQVQVQCPHIQELQITQVSCASPRWMVESLSISDQEGLRVGSRETLQLTLKGKKADSTAAEEFLFTEVPFDIQQISSVKTPCCDFFFHSVVHRKCKDPSKSDTPVPRRHHRPPPDFSRLNRALEINLTLIFLWKAFVAQENGQMKILVGQHHVHIDKVNTVATSYPFIMSNNNVPPLKFMRDLEPQTKSQPSLEVTTKLISFSFVHDQTVQHNFSKGICVVPVTLKLQNQSETAVDILVDTSKSSDRLGSTHAESTMLPMSYHTSQPMNSSFRWVGQTLARLSLGPGAGQHVTLRAAFCHPGIYNLNNLAVFVTYSDDMSQMISQKHSTPSIITLNTTSL